MKKDSVILIRFLILLVAATAAGTIAGRLQLPLAQGDIFLPQLLYAAPPLLILSAASFVYVVCTGHSRHLRTPVVLAATGFGVALSGFCGAYSLSHFTLFIIFAVATVAVIVAAAVYRHLRVVSFVTTGTEKSAVLLFFAAAFLAAFFPVGPLPVLLAGILWLKAI